MLTRASQSVCIAGLLIASLGIFSLATLSGQTGFNERMVRTVPSTLDKLDVWGMDVIFKDPRIIRVRLPARGDRMCWYLWYQVMNYTGKPREISPYFELVTLDYPGVYRDEILITAEEMIRRIEDPTGYQDVKNTVLISKFAI